MHGRNMVFCGRNPRSPARRRAFGRLVCRFTLALLTLWAQESWAQSGGLADTLVFQRASPSFVDGPARALAFDRDTLHVDHSSFIQRVVTDGDWTVGWVPSFIPAIRSSIGDLRFDPDGVIYQWRENFKYDRSDDRGQTWVRADYPATVMPFHTPGGALLGTWNVMEYGVARSEDDGETWVPLPYVPSASPALPYVYLALPPAEGRPAPRIVACGKSALAYSDDDGRTWSGSNISGPNAILCWSMVTIMGGEFDGYLLAAVDDYRGPQPKAGIFRTEDGATWERVGQVFEDGTTVYLSGGTGGVVLAWDTGHDRVAGTDDGGATWPLLTASISGIPVATHLVKLNDLEIGPDGHVYAATHRFLGEGDGLYRSVTPAFLVSSETPPATSSELSLTVRPNPSDGRVKVEVVTNAPATVRLSVVDALGREVALVYEGAVADRREVAVETAGLAPGVYVVRAAVAGRVVGSTTFSVVR